MPTRCTISLFNSNDDVCGEVHLKGDFDGVAYIIEAVKKCFDHPVETNDYARPCRVVVELEN